MPLVCVIDLNPKVSTLSETDCSNTQVFSIIDFESSFIETDFDTCFEDLTEIIENVENVDCHRAIPMSILPFRVAFTTVDTGGYSPQNPAPIGIAIIGFTNYIL